MSRSGTAGAYAPITLNLIDKKIAKRRKVCPSHDDSGTYDKLGLDIAGRKERSGFGAQVRKGKRPKIALPRQVKLTIAKRFLNAIRVNSLRLLGLLCHFKSP